jgi:hypothetical protein
VDRKLGWEEKMNDRLGSFKHEFNEISLKIT